MEFKRIYFCTVLIGVLSGVIVLYYPKLGLPDSPTFQLLEGEHPFELYDTKYRYLYQFERSFTVKYNQTGPIFDSHHSIYDYCF